MIEQVEDLTTEFELGMSYRETLADGEVHSLGARAADGITPGVALSAGRRHHVCRRVEPASLRWVVELAEITRRDEVDALRHIVAALADVGRRYRERKAACNPDDPLHLPA